MLTTFIAPYRIPLFRALERKVKELRVFVSTAMEKNRQWSPEWEDLPVTVQRSLTLPRTWRHPGGFSERMYLHIPLDTLPLLRRFHPDVVISAELGARTLQANMYARKGAAFIIWTTLSEETERGRGPLRRLLRKRLLRRADIVLVNGASAARYIASFGVPASRMVIVPYTTEVDAFPGAPIAKTPETAGRLIYVGRLSAGKGVVACIHALAGWAASHPELSIELVIAGHGPVEREAAGVRTPPNLRVTMLGAVPYEDLPGIYARAGAFLFPTLADEWGVVVNEAMAAGLPVLGSVYSQAVQELVREGVTGWTFRPDDPKDFERVLDEYFATSLDELNVMGRAARARSLELDPDTVANAMVDAIERASASPRR